MKKTELLEIFEEYNDDHSKFEKVENKLSSRPDLHVFLLLDRLHPGDSDIVSAAEHDIIYLNVDIEDIIDVITKEQVIELIRCGVMVEDREYFSMFV